MYAFNALHQASSRLRHKDDWIKGSIEGDALICRKTHLRAHVSAIPQIGTTMKCPEVLTILSTALVVQAAVAPKADTKQIVFTEVVSNRQSKY